MKKLKLLLFVALLASIFSFAYEENRHVGKWEGNDKGQIIILEFDKDRYLTIETKGEKMGGKEFTINEKKAALKYVIDYQCKPITLDIIAVDLQTKIEKRTVGGILEFKGNNKMKLAFESEDKQRPKKFTKANSVLFTRIE